jgi:hypothetical protein
MRNLKKASAVWVASAIILMAFLTKIPFSLAGNSTGLTGSCGFLVQRSFGGFGNAQVGYNFTHNIIGIIDFDKSTVSGTLNQLYNYEQTNANIVTSTNTNVPVFISNGPFSGSYYMSFTSTGEGAFIIVPVNGGNSFLISQKGPVSASSNPSDPALTGVCQKI